jgi:hypothetical protein
MKETFDVSNHPTIKTYEVLPCNQYYNVVLSNGEGAWTGRVVTYLTLEDWCMLYGYRLWVRGTHQYVALNDKIRTNLSEVNSFVC